MHGPRRRERAEVGRPLLPALRADPAREQAEHRRAEEDGAEAADEQDGRLARIAAGARAGRAGRAGRPGRAARARHAAHAGHAGRTERAGRGRRADRAAGAAGRRSGLMRAAGHGPSHSPGRGDHREVSSAARTGPVPPHGVTPARAKARARRDGPRSRRRAGAPISVRRAAARSRIVASPP